METQEALEIVSYKLGAKNGTAALSDTVLIPTEVELGIADKANGTLRKIDAKSYMMATKLVKAERLRLARVAGEEFLSNNANLEGITTTASGLQFKVLQSGSGPAAELSDLVSVEYHGTLIDGTVFDSSIDRGSAAQFRVNKVIAGWQEGLQLMPTGAKYQLFIPQELAYGERGTETTVPPFATLIFEVELLSIEHHAP